MKLTGPQRALLMDLAETERYVNDTYPPLKKLRELGYVDGRVAKYGGGRFKATEAGIAALASENTP